MLAFESEGRSSRLPVVLTLSLLFTFAVPALAGAQTSYRLTSIDYDYDNNGTVDATSVLSYDAAGVPTGFTYDYVGDGTPDLFVTEDDEAQSEIATYLFDASGLLTDYSLDRTNMSMTTESFDIVQTFTAGQITRSDSDSNVEGLVSSTYSTFSYVGSDLDTVVERRTSDDALQLTLTYAYGGDSLPDVVTLSSPGAGGFPGLDIVTTYTWRGDGQADDVSSVWTQGMTTIGGGSGDYVYDAQGRRIAEVFTVDMSQGAFPAEFFGLEYRKTIHYDALGLPDREEVDVGDDGSVEATRTATWEAGPCTPVFIWAPNGRPEFIEMPGTPYVPGTGWQSLQNCPEPGLAVSLLAGTAGLAAVSRRRGRG